MKWVRASDKLPPTSLTYHVKVNGNIICLGCYKGDDVWEITGFYSTTWKSKFVEWLDESPDLSGQHILSKRANDYTVSKTHRQANLQKYELICEAFIAGNNSAIASLPPVDEALERLEKEGWISQRVFNVFKADLRKLISYIQTPYK